MSGRAVDGVLPLSDWADRRGSKEVEMHGLMNNPCQVSRKHMLMSWPAFQRFAEEDAVTSAVPCSAVTRSVKLQQSHSFYTQDSPVRLTRRGIHVPAFSEHPLWTREDPSL